MSDGTTKGLDERVLVLSPHRDDAAFSCGLLLLALLCAGGSATLVNICTVSDYAPYLPDLSDVIRVRAAEDVKFDAELGARAQRQVGTTEWLDLRWKDAPLRMDVGAAEAYELAPYSEHELAALAEQFRALPTATVVLAPLAMGGHPDHRMVRDAARKAFEADRVVFYEDLPYAAWKETAPVVDAGVGWLSPAAAAGVKRDFSNVYSSQIAPDVAELMEEYGAALGYRERMWGERPALDHLQRMVEVRA